MSGWWGGGGGADCPGGGAEDRLGDYPLSSFPHLVLRTPAACPNHRENTWAQNKSHSGLGPCPSCHLGPNTGESLRARCIALYPSC